MSQYIIRWVRTLAAIAAAIIVIVIGLIHFGILKLPASPAAIPGSPEECLLYPNTGNGGFRPDFCGLIK